MEKGQGKRTDTLQTDKVFTRKEYIEREAVVKLLKAACKECRETCEEFDGFYADCNQCIMHSVVNGVPSVPASDVVPVVRCRDCKHRDPEDKKCDCGGLEHAHMFPVSDDWFCADGEREDGNGE